MPFIPLDRATVERIAEQELKLVEQRDGLLRRGVTLRISPQALELLARRGYNPHYGARSLKRVIKREILLPLAIDLNSRPTPAEGKRTTTIAQVDVKAGHLTVEIDGESKSAHVDRVSPREWIGWVSCVEKLARSPAIVELQIWRLSEIERRIHKAARRVSRMFDRAEERRGRQAASASKSGGRPKAANVKKY